MRQAVIVGLGLIGGSIAGALAGFEDFIRVGVDVSQPTLRHALEHDIVDRAEEDPQKALAEGDLVGILEGDEEQGDKIVDDSLHDIADEAGVDGLLIAVFHR